MPTTPPLPEFNEGSDAPFQLKLKRDPTTIVYRVDDCDTGAALLADTNFPTPSASSLLNLPASAQVIVGDPSRESEVHLLTVRVTYPDSKKQTIQQRFRVLNLFFLGSTASPGAGSGGGGGATYTAAAPLSIDPANRISLSVGSGLAVALNALTLAAHALTHAAAGSDPISPASIGAAPIASPTFTGAPAAPTPNTGDRSTRIATTGFVGAELAALGTAASKNVAAAGTAGGVLASDDATTTNARTPTAHKSTHATGGTDALTPSDIGAQPAFTSQAANLVYAAPSGSAGPPVFRALVALDLPTTVVRTDANPTIPAAAAGNDGADWQLTGSAGNGTNKKGGNLILLGGAPTGTGAPGRVRFPQISDGTKYMEVFAESGIGVVGGPNTYIDLRSLSGTRSRNSDNTGYLGFLGASFADAAADSVYAASSWGGFAAASTKGFGLCSGTASGGAVDWYLSRAAVNVAQFADGTANTNGATFRSKCATLSQFTADQNDLAVSARMYYRVSADTTRNWSGMTCGQVDGQTCEFWFVGGTVVIKHDTTSTPANRFFNSTGADISFASGEAALVRYDGTRSRWYVRKA